MAEQTSLKIACLGGGSRYWAVNLIKDLALRPDLEGELALYDPDETALRVNLRKAEIIRAAIAHGAAATHRAAGRSGERQTAGGVKVTAAASLKEAIKGSDFTVISIQPGPIEMMQSDLDVPARYGIYQTVGDTTGPGGLLRALRTIPLFTDFARAVMEWAPRAWVINYTNPLAVAVATLYAVAQRESGNEPQGGEFPAIKALGCCHEVRGMRAFATGLARERLDAAGPASAGDVSFDVAGVNHFTFATQARFQGRDLFPLFRKYMEQKDFFADRSEISRARKAAGEYFVSDKRVAFDFFRRFGALGAAGDRHLAEFVPWYLKSEEEAHRWGMILTPSSYRLARTKIVPPEEDAAILDLKPSGEETVELMLALSGAGDLSVAVNLPNRGQIEGLAEGAVVESYAAVSSDRVNPLPASPLPAALGCLVKRIIEVQRLTLEAGLRKDADLAFQALLLDPLVAIPTDRAYAMFREMLENTKSALPGFKI